MKKGAMILGIIACIIGLIGGASTTLFAGCGEAVRRADEDLKKKGVDTGSTKITAEETQTVAGLGFLEIIASVVGLVLAIIIGVSKGPAWISSGLLVVCGILALIGSGWIAGPLIAVAGIFGLIGSRKGKPEAAPASAA